jgi:hypothetical protein
MAEEEAEFKASPSDNRNSDLHFAARKDRC